MFEAQLLEVTRSAATADVGSVGDDDLVAAASMLAVARRALAAAEAHVLAELDARDTCDRDHGLRTGHWWAREAASPVGAARGQVRVATTLRALLGETDAALAAGQISYDHARVLAEAANPRIAHHIAALQHELIALAQGMVFDTWRRHVAALVDLLDADGGHHPADDLARNRLHLARAGAAHDLRGTLTGDNALIAEHAINTKADELFDRFTRDHDRCPDIPVPSRATLRALAFVELCRAGLATDPTASEPPRTEATVVTHASDPTTGATPDGVPLADGTTRTLLCDPDLHAVVVDNLGIPLDHGRRTRYATPAQRRAVTLRDGGCVFDGCDAPVTWCDIHHVTPWSRGGSTDLANLVCLGRHHHTITHRPGWTMTATADGWFTFVTPRGHTVPSQRHHRRRAGPAPPGC